MEMKKPENTNHLFHYPLDHEEELSLGDIINMAVMYFGSDVQFNQISIKYISFEAIKDLYKDYLQIERLNGTVHYAVSDIPLVKLQPSE